MKIIDVALLAINVGPMVQPMIDVLDQNLKTVEGYFNFKKSVLLTDKDIKHPIHEVKKIPELNFDSFNLFMIKELYKYIDTPHYLIVQTDGYILHPEVWDDSWLNYDYMGAPWPPHILRDLLGNGAIGNGGFSLRSRFLTNHVCLKNKDRAKIIYHEDGHYSNAMNREPVLKYPSHNIAMRFSQELVIDKNIVPFGFHGKPHDPSYKYWINKEIN
jgi:hypothetical protein